MNGVVQIGKVTGKEKLEELTRAKCPDCDYQMPIYFGVDANCCGVMVPCKGRNCHTLFELKIKEGNQIM